MRSIRGHHAFNHAAVLGAVKAASLRSAAAFRGASGLDRACAQRAYRAFADGRYTDRFFEAPTCPYFNRSCRLDPLADRVNLRWTLRGRCQLWACRRRTKYH